MTAIFQEEPLLQELVDTYVPKEHRPWAQKQLQWLGSYVYNEMDRRAAFTDREGEPKLFKYDAYGREQSYVRVDEGYARTAADIYGAGIVGGVFRDVPELGAPTGYVFSFLQGYLVSQSEPGFYCPVTLTMASAYLLDRYAEGEARAKFLPGVTALGEEKLEEGATFLTERQGGSDVGANAVEALPEPDRPGVYRLYGEKYFASNAGRAEVMMVLARTPESGGGSRGLSLFAVPWYEGADKNRLSIRRLKDKLGVRAVPSGEVEFDGAEAWMIGEETRGLSMMMEALNLSRVCNAAASAGIMRRAYREALQYASGREAFGSRLTDFPMVQDTFTRLAVKLEAEVRTVFYTADRFEAWTNGQEEDAYLRLLVALVKEESADQAIHFAHEAVEMLGGNGYIEDFVTPRLLRDAQVLTVWEGTRNILGLEVLRLMNKTGVHEQFFSRLLASFEASGLEEAAVVKAMAEELEESCRGLLELPAAEQTRYVKPLMKKMVSLLEVQQLLEAGAEDTASMLIRMETMPRFDRGEGSWTLDEGMQRWQEDVERLKPEQ
ncbi:acyl-CoA dehydrogenase family protein [Alkalicoccus chagannorensis]|uniref:acyl-CoA dehydrogenase family protein n=1 Tax=Alkalicoccus chagannorensis TaxID=427072 RepID=UPI0003F6893A|nr:acyl-CoA dehydrogenase family protein [Alkalicoccus chagannorensis]